MNNEVNKEIALRIAEAWDKYLTKLDKKKKAEIFADYNKYIEEYSNFVKSCQIFK